MWEFIADVKSYANYYPFGMEMPGRTSNSSSYRYGYNGKEKDNETNTYDYGARIYNPALAKFLSMDPMAGNAPGWTPYRGFYDNPIYFIDEDGEEEKAALKWVVDHLKGKPSDVAPRSGMKRGKVPDWAVCNQVVYLGFINVHRWRYQKNGFREQSRIGMFNWFNRKHARVMTELITGHENSGIKVHTSVDGTNSREYKVDFAREDFNKVGAGDVLFLGKWKKAETSTDDALVPWGAFQGHSVLAVEMDKAKSTDASVVIRVFGAYSRDESGDKIGYEEMTFTRQEIIDAEGNKKMGWVSSHDREYVLYGIGRVLNSKNSNLNIDDIIKEARNVKSASPTPTSNSNQQQ